MARTPLMKQVRRFFHLAQLANEPGAPPVEELLARERQLRLSRRNFLMAGAALLAAGPFAQGCAGSDVQFSKEGEAQPDGAQPSIAIIGAGIAGLNAALVLSKAGFSSTVYEAQNRVGGRMFTVTDVFGPGISTELGGEFIDSGHEEMLSLVGEFGLPLLDVLSASELDLVPTTWNFGGVNLSEAEVIALFQPLADQITADQDSLPDTIDFTTQDATAVGLDNTSMAEYFDQIGATGTIRTILDVAFETENGLPPSQQSALNFLARIDPDTSSGTLAIFGESDQRFKIEGGNERLPQAIAASLSGTAPVNTGHKLLSVREVDGGFTLTFDAPGGTVEVTADYVICTIPFTVLRSLELDVTLPDRVRTAIQTTAYGTNSKLIMGFQTRYWRNLGATGLFFTDRPNQSGWDSTQLQVGTAGSLTNYLGGPKGVEIEQGTPESRALGFLPEVEGIFPGANAQFTGVARRFVWPTFPFTLASYSTYGPGQITTLLGAPDDIEGNFFFAGEHTSVDYFGYMEGGAESGRRAAEELLGRLGVAVQPRKRLNRGERRRERRRKHAARELELLMSV